MDCFQPERDITRHEIIEILRIFWNFSQAIFVPFVPVSKISEFLVKWQAPNISTYSIFNSLHTVSEHGTASYIALQSS